MNHHFYIKQKLEGFFHDIVFLLNKIDSEAQGPDA